MEGNSSGGIDWDMLRRSVDDHADEYIRRLPPAPSQLLPSSSSELGYGGGGVRSQTSLVPAASLAPLGESSRGSTAEILNAVSESHDSVKSDIQNLASSHSNTFSAIFQNNKENRSSIHDLQSQQSSLARALSNVEDDLHALTQRQMMTVEALDHANGMCSKHQVRTELTCYYFLFFLFFFCSR